MPKKSHRLAALVGNGLSTAFSRELSLPAITTEVMSLIAKAEGGPAIDAMQEIAEALAIDGTNPTEDFEQLVGAFGSEARSLGILDTLASLKDPIDEDLRASISRVVEFANEVRDSGISYVLEVIAKRSHAQHETATELNALIGEILKAFEHRVTFGNLNYDTLLLAALLEKCTGLVDMGDGRRSAKIEFGRRKVPAHLLREEEADFDLGDERVKLLHLHGSVTYWTDSDTGQTYKIDAGFSRRPVAWRALREGETKLRPAVVLANGRDKPNHVGTQPFQLAYEVFSSDLDEASHWLIVGYSFRDTPVNGMLRDHFQAPKKKPKILVVTRGEEPNRTTIENALGWRTSDGSSDSWLSINRDGAYDLVDSNEWLEFLK